MSTNTFPLVPGAGPRQVNSSADVVAHLPDILLRPESDVVRDALVAALTDLLREWQFRTDYAAALADPIRSVQQYLVALGSDRGVGKAINEDEESYRARFVQQRQSVTEPALIAGINAILSLVTPTECQLNDAGLDGWFIHDGTDGAGGPAKWHSFVGSGVGSGPNYPDRYFTDDAVNNGGEARPNSRVDGARVYKDTVGRLLLVRLPDVGFQLRDAALVFNGSTVPEFGFFVGDGVAPPGGAFIDASSLEPAAVYRAIANFLSATLGQSVRWEMTSDIVAA